MSKYVQRIKLGIIGQSGVGKTHFLHGFLHGDPSQRKIAPTQAVQFYQRVIMVQNQEVSLRMWDTSGQEKYKPIVAYHLQECQVLIFMYDVTETETLLELQKWINSLRKDGMDFTCKKLLFIGNKLDLVRQDARLRQVRYEQVKEMLLKLKLPITDIYQVSSNDIQTKDVTYIHEILQEILTQVLQQRTQDEVASMKVKLGAQGIVATQHQEHASSNEYCGECNIF